MKETTKRKNRAIKEIIKYYSKLCDISPEDDLLDYLDIKGAIDINKLSERYQINKRKSSTNLTEKVLSLYADELKKKYEGRAGERVM